MAAAQPDGFGAVWADSGRGRTSSANGAAATSWCSCCGTGAADPELTARLKDVRARTLLALGQVRRIVPCAQAEAIHSWLPGSHLELVDQAGHVPMFERRETMNRLIHDFLVAAA